MWHIKHYKNRSSSVFKAHLYRHLAAEGVPTGDCVPAWETAKRDALKLKCDVQWLLLSHSLSFTHTHTHTHIHTHTHTHTHITVHVMQSRSVCTCWRKVVRTGSKHMPTERSSQTAGQATREKKTKSVSTGSNTTICLAKGSVGMHVSIRETHPIFLRLHIELVSDPGQRMDGFGQH